MVADGRAGLVCVDLALVATASLATTVGTLGAASPLPVGLVTEGPQVRTGLVAADVALETGDIVRLTPDKVLGNRGCLSVRPAALFSALRAGSRLGIDGGPLLRVGRIDGSTATTVVVEGGEVGSNRVVTVDPAPALPALTAKDVRALGLAGGLGIRHVVLSFASSSADIDWLRRLVPGAEVIARIESRAGVWNRDEIIEAADAVALDPPSLLRELSVEQVPLYQDAIVRQAAREGIPLYRPASGAGLRSAPLVLQ